MAGVNSKVLHNYSIQLFLHKQTEIFQSITKSEKKIHSFHLLSWRSCGTRLSVITHVFSDAVISEAPLCDAAMAGSTPLCSRSITVPTHFYQYLIEERYGLVNFLAEPATNLVIM